MYVDWENLTLARKIEVFGYLEANRLGNPEWETYNSFCGSEDGLVGVTLDNEDDEVGDGCYE